ncbi:hypothetical protein CQ14_36545 [Bradyrhizobium lablabi]|uniref:Uncharacterized protein n=1 Tax=Bradyrhizobium lablabi TaxID=722472 RepID=A0A0R3MW16_9BRAD|nr:hypothetical protein [Bradyrhizobium lablabi]KRR22213.1 hypothetical protein CQ14_36545 [Bradyrhizobium lablabi]
MKVSRLLVVLTAVNLAILLFAAVRVLPEIDEVAPVLRGRALQIVDEQGHVRASISVMPAQAQPNGETYPETVLLRLITERGRPSVKISASEETAGATFAGPTDTTNTYTILQAKRTASSLRLKDEDGGETLIKPAK